MNRLVWINELFVEKTVIRVKWLHIANQSIYTPISLMCCVPFQRIFDKEVVMNHSSTFLK